MKCVEIPIKQLIQSGVKPVDNMFTLNGTRFGIVNRNYFKPVYYCLTINSKAQYVYYKACVLKYNAKEQLICRLCRLCGKIGLLKEFEQICISNIVKNLKDKVARWQK